MFHLNGDTFSSGMVTRGDPAKVEVVSYLSKSAIKKKASETGCYIYFDASGSGCSPIAGSVMKTSDTPPLCGFLRMHIAFPTLSLSAGEEEMAFWAVYTDVTGNHVLVSIYGKVKNDAGTYKLWLREPFNANFDIEVGTVVIDTEYVLELHVWKDKIRVYFGTPSSVAYVNEAAYSHIGDWMLVNYALLSMCYRSDVEIALFSVYTDRIEVNYTAAIDAIKHNGSDADGNVWCAAETYLDAGVPGGNVVKGTSQNVNITAAQLAADTNWLLTNVVSDNRAGASRKIHVDSGEIKDGWI